MALHRWTLLKLFRNCILDNRFKITRTEYSRICVCNTRITRASPDHSFSWTPYWNQTIHWTSRRKKGIQPIISVLFHFVVYPSDSLSFTFDIPKNSPAESWSIDFKNKIAVNKYYFSIIIFYKDNTGRFFKTKQIWESSIVKEKYDIKTKKTLWRSTPSRKLHLITDEL